MYIDLLSLISLSLLKLWNLYLKKWNNSTYFNNSTPVKSNFTHFRSNYTICLSYYINSSLFGKILNLLRNKFVIILHHYHVDLKSFWTWCDRWTTDHYLILFLWNLHICLVSVTDVKNNLFSINKIVFWLEFFLCLGGLNWHTALLSQLDGSICWELMRVKAVKASLNWNIWFPDLGLAGQVIPSWFVKWNKNSINRVKKETAKLFFDFYFFFKMIN